MIQSVTCQITCKMNKRGERLQNKVTTQPIPPHSHLSQVAIVSAATAGIGLGHS